jgi:hydroxymethylglutaryl-CoA lyase
MLHRCGHATGIELAAAIDAGQWLQERLGRPVPGMLVKAGDFAGAWPGGASRGIC